MVIIELSADANEHYVLVGALNEGIVSAVSTTSFASTSGSLRLVSMELAARFTLVHANRACDFLKTLHQTSELMVKRMPLTRKGCADEPANHLNCDLVEINRYELELRLKRRIAAVEAHISKQNSVSFLPYERLWQDIDCFYEIGVMSCLDEISLFPKIGEDRSITNIDLAVHFVGVAIRHVESELK